MRRTALVRTPMKRKPSKGNAAWVARRDAWLAENPACVMAMQYTRAGECWNPPEVKRNDVHHIQPRGMGGTTEDDSPLVTLCRKHHQYVEEHREWARSVGLLMRRTA